MTVIVDTGVLYANHDADASRHDSANTALSAVYNGRLGQPYVSDYIYDEAVTLTLKRSGSFSVAKELGKHLRGDEYAPVYEMLRVSTPVFDRSVELFEQYDDQALSFTDATTIALSERHDIDSVLSFDDDFDGLVERIDPASVADQ